MKVETPQIAADMAWEAERLLWDQQSKAAEVAVGEVLENDGNPGSFDHFLLAAHGISRTFSGFARQDELEAKSFYAKLEEQFGFSHHDNLIALLSHDNNEKHRRNIIKIGRISTDKSLDYRIFTPGLYAQIEASTLVRVRKVTDTIDRSWPDLNNRFNDKMLIDQQVVNEGDSELWRLSRTSILGFRNRGIGIGNYSSLYAVGVDQILAARHFNERGRIDSEQDSVYLSIVHEALAAKY
jgi:hypothetical protein